MTISGTEAVKKIMDLSVSKNGCEPMQSSADLFQLLCIGSLPCAYFFKCCSEAFGVTCVPRPEQLVRSTPLLP